MKGKRIYLPVLTLAILLTLSFLFSSYKTRQAADDFWKALGLSQQAGTDGIKNSFLNGYLQFYSARNAKNIALNDRKAVATDLLNYTKQYISGPVFKKQYEDMRKNAEPHKPEAAKVKTLEDIRKEEIAKTEKSIKDLEKSMKEVSADIAKSLKPVLDMQKQTLKDYQDPKNEMLAIIYESEKQSAERRQQDYVEDLAAWQKNYPENINQFIADKLKKMLDATKGIDYNAALVEKYNKKRFANPAYESKSTEWKQGFRAGKDVTETARAFAQQWLGELK
ncbi:MAG: hypothetical protein DI535_26720 [Citrobacter freundii]|nr:MAG: hypothetical protein DI535_26720 [Citrobacter freundii]